MGSRFDPGAGVHGLGSLPTPRRDTRHPPSTGPLALVVLIAVAMMIVLALQLKRRRGGGAGTSHALAEDLLLAERNERYAG